LRESHAAVTVPVAPATEAPTADREPVFTGSTGSALDRARAASQGYVQGVLASSSHREAPGVRGYLWGVRRRVSEVWRPGVARVPNLADTLLAGFLAPDRAIRTAAERFMQRQRQVLAEPPPRLEGAADAIEAIGGVAGNGPSGRQNIPTNTTEESWRRNSRTTRAEVQVEQDATGRVTDVRLVRSSGLATFDNAALDAVRQGVAEEDPIPLPGGRRSRWSFTVTATRRLIAPNIGGSFDESRGWFQVQLPGQVLLRSRVQLENSAPLDAPAPASP
jgi:TonB family protein